MNDKTLRSLKQFYEISKTGHFGAAVKKATEEYRTIPSGNELYIKMVRDFYVPALAQAPLITDFVKGFSSELISLFCNVRLVDARVAQGFLNSLTEDFPDTNNTALLSRWQSLAEANAVLMSSSHNDNPITLWRQQKDVLESAYEFLSRLGAYIIIMIRAGNRLPYSHNVLSNKSGAIINELQEINKKNEIGLKHFFSPIKPGLRNALAHRNIDLNLDNGKVECKRSRTT